MGLHSTNWTPSEGFEAGAELKERVRVGTENSENLLKWFSKDSKGHG